MNRSASNLSNHKITHRLMSMKGKILARHPQHLHLLLQYQNRRIQSFCFSFSFSSSLFCSRFCFVRSEGQVDCRSGQIDTTFACKISFLFLQRSNRVVLTAFISCRVSAIKRSTSSCHNFYKIQQVFNNQENLGKIS